MLLSTIHFTTDKTRHNNVFFTQSTDSYVLFDHLSGYFHAFFHAEINNFMGALKCCLLSQSYHLKRKLARIFLCSTRNCYGYSYTTSRMLRSFTYDNKTTRSTKLKSCHPSSYVKRKFSLYHNSKSSPQSYVVDFILCFCELPWRPEESKKYQNRIIIYQCKYLLHKKFLEARKIY